MSTGLRERLKGNTLKMGCSEALSAEVTSKPRPGGAAAGRVGRTIRLRPRDGRHLGLVEKLKRVGVTDHR